MPPSTVVVLADDLTSAADGAAPFRRNGHRALVLFAPEGAARDSGVTAVDLGTRLLGEQEAAARTREAAAAYADAELLIKTVDSTLRGHVAAELRAALAGSGRRTAILAPAFPAEGRTTVGGVQYVGGVRVDASDFARDPAHPVHSADLARLLPEAVVLDPVGGPAPVSGPASAAAADPGLASPCDSGPARTAGPARTLGSHPVPAPPPAFRPDSASGPGGDPGPFAELPRLVDAGGILVCSATTDADLDAVVAAVPRPQDVLWVGSPGLADALARRHARRPADPRPGLPAVRRPLTVVGSANPVSRRQLAALRARPTGSRPPVAALHTPEERAADPADAAALIRRLAEETRQRTEDGLADGLVLTGGETAAAVLGALGGTGIELYDEPEPGIARGILHGAEAPRLPVLVKAGGFGDDGALVRLHALVAAGGDR
ncbi:four-carbon acid sugar kinase family protein [Streptomyces sp. NPDC012769]|uniref:four-carbon acid sugar kinase family protein n=1 Tax=Streptomyces sp. NPDC012769 TaxID=3364848 RepID=UPI0036B9C759